MTSLGRYWRTLRHLKLQQFTGRLVFKLWKPRLPTGPVPVPNTRPVAGKWVPPAQREASLRGPGQFVFLNEPGDLADLGWDGPGPSKLWRYNQHYFDDLNALDAAARRAWHNTLLQSWVADNPATAGSGWEPYPTSLRVVNWVKWWLGGAPTNAAQQASLCTQARWLRRRMEWHLLGNHLFANAKALVFAGLLFEGAEADEWLACGLRVLEREIPEQVLPDGGQFERSPMYHALALEDVLDLLNAFKTFGAPNRHAAKVQAMCLDHAPRMLHWLQCMSHPDGGIAFFNDGAHGIAPSNAELNRYAAALGVSASSRPEGKSHKNTQWLAASGYARVERDGLVALLDLAPVGPDYLPGHAHADTLSMEFSLSGQRVLVNGGTSCYGTSARRLAERGTAAHNTVQVADEDSSEVWSGFRVGRRAYPLNVRVDADQISAEHNGYKWLPGQPVHRRAWSFGGNSLLVEDLVTPNVDNAVARYHLAPGLRLLSADLHIWHVLREDEFVAQLQVLQGDAEVTESVHAPRFGQIVETQCLTVRLSASRAAVRWIWGSDAHLVLDRQLSAGS